MTDCTKKKGIPVDCEGSLTSSVQKATDPKPKTAISGGAAYSLAYVRSHENNLMENRAGGRTSYYDAVLHQWRMRIRLDEQGVWFLSVFIREDGCFQKYSLDKELAADSHYEFTDEAAVRQQLYASGDENRYLAEVLMRYLHENSGDKLLRVIYPYITAQFHFD